MRPTIGRIVHYRLTYGDTVQLNQNMMGNRYVETELVSAIIVRVYEGVSQGTVNLRIINDGESSRDLWIQGVDFTDSPNGEEGFWHWPVPVPSFVPSSLTETNIKEKS